MSESSPWVFDATAAGFQEEVVDRSAKMTVVVDFWAPWCQPCRSLGPMLEKLINESNGKLALAKVNIDQEQELAAAFGVQSIPAVFAVRDGQLVDHFQGLLPETQLREWLKSLLPSAIEELIKRGEELEGSDPVSAEQCYREAAEADPTNDAIRIRLARVLLAQSRDEEARQIITDLESRGYLEPEAEQIKSQLDIRESAAETGGVEEARAAVEANPENLSLKIKLADALAVSRKFEEALDLCLEVIQADRDGVGQEAKTTMLKIFDLIGPSSAIVSTYRRKLATALY
jgi:putative thioredoxin